MNGASTKRGLMTRTASAVATTGSSHAWPGRQASTSTSPSSTMSKRNSRLAKVRGDRPTAGSDLSAGVGGPTAGPVVLLGSFVLDMPDRALLPVGNDVVHGRAKGRAGQLNPDR